MDTEKAVKFKDTQTKKLKKVSSACDSCRKRHARCDGENPCNHCTRQKIQCNFTLHDKRRRKSRNEQTWALETQVEELQSTLEVLKNGTGNEVTIALNNLRSHLTDVSISPIQGSTGDDIQRERYTLQSLPDEQFIRRGAESSFSTLDGIFWVMDPSEFDILCQKLYHTDTKSIFDLAEVLSFSISGWHVESEFELEDQKEILFHTTTQYMYDIVGLNNVRAVKIFICLAIYGILKRKTTTKNFVWLAMQILRSVRRNSTDLQWRRMFRTIIILECWLSTLLGSSMNFTIEENDLVQDDTTNSTLTRAEIGEIKISQIAFLRAQIYQSTWYSDNYTNSEVEENLKRLSNWHSSLPDYMGLSSLMTGEETSSFNPKTLLLIHVLYLGAELALHRYILIAVADNAFTGQWKLNPTLRDQSSRYCESAVNAARSSTRIFIYSNLGNDTHRTFLRCWICSFEMLSSCTVLLYDVAFRLSMGTWTNLGIEEDLQRIRSCLHLLGDENDEDDDAAISELKGILHSIELIWSSISESSDYKTMAQRIIIQICQILKDPFRQNDDTNKKKDVEQNR